jgi:filamentous hemagglutinin
MGGGYHGGFGNTKGSVAVGDASFMGSSDRFLRFIRKRADVDPGGKFDIIAHGTASSIEIEHNGTKMQVNSRTAARLIKQLPEYKGQAIRLLSCSTGTSSAGFAQNLANKLGVTVYAPSEKLWAWGDGKYVIAPTSGKLDRYGNPQPDLGKRGKFIKYVPGGNKR